MPKVRPPAAKKKPQKGSDGKGLTSEKIRESIKSVIDPELGINIVDLGLIYDIVINKGVVKVRMTLTTPMCPIGPMLVDGVKRAVEGVKGVKNVDVEVTFDPPWTMERISPEFREKLGFGV